jgi:putative membrane protein
MTAALVAFAHHALAFLLVAALLTELVLLKNQLTVPTARSILRMDVVYGVCAAALLIVGFARVFHTEKGVAYYFISAPFILKIALFVIVGLLSIYPTRQFLSWRRVLATGRAPTLTAQQVRRLRLVIHVELTLLFIIMLCAALMARGIGVLG